MIVVFDLDGTLIDSVPDMHAVANAVLAQEGLGHVTLAQARGFVGHGAPTFVRRMMAAVGVAEDAQLHARLLAAFLKRYETAHDLTALYPRVEAALARLETDGARLAVCTNKPIVPTRAVLRHFGMETRFDTVLGGDSLAQRKPDPEPLLHVIAQMGGGPAVFVGDSEVDAETADRAGIPFALFSLGYRKTPVEDLPHRWVFDDFDVLPDIVKEAREA